VLQAELLAGGAPATATQVALGGELPSSPEQATRRNSVPPAHVWLQAEYGPTCQEKTTHLFVLHDCDVTG
jgi:hypothetical protein